MMRKMLLILTVTWSLVGAPMLCRAGVLVRCCAQPTEDRSRAKSAECEDRCCDHPDGNAQVPDSDERECDSCVALCGAVAKPVDDDQASSQAELAIASCCPVAVATVSRSSMRVHAPERPPDVPRIPFPSCDIPLLI